MVGSGIELALIIIGDIRELMRISNRMLERKDLAIKPPQHNIDDESI
jgi:hypothetical protein